MAELCPSIRPDCHVEFAGKNDWRGNQWRKAFVLRAGGMWRTVKQGSAAAHRQTAEWYRFGVYAILPRWIGANSFRVRSTASCSRLRGYGVGFLGGAGPVIGRSATQRPQTALVLIF